MNFLRNQLIPAALLAGVSSFVMTVPASALDFKGVNKMTFSGVYPAPLGTYVEGTNVFDFGSNGITPGGVVLTSVLGNPAWVPSILSTGNAYDVDFDADLPGHTLFSIALNNTPGETLQFILNSASISDNDPFQAVFSGTMQLLTGGATYSVSGDFSSDGDGKGWSFTAVPTPAAVLPVLAGLFGAASKRKREAESLA